MLSLRRGFIDDTTVGHPFLAFLSGGSCFSELHSNPHGGNTPQPSTQPPRSGSPAVSTSQEQRTPRPHEPTHRPHSPKNPSSSVFSTIDLDESDTNSPVIPRRLRKRAVPKIVESAFGRNEQSSPVRSFQIRADSSSDFDLLVERRAARKAGASKHLEVHTTRDDMTWEELQGLRRNTPEPGPSSPSTSNRGSMEPRAPSSLSSGLTPRLRSRPVPSNGIDVTEKKMIEAREELSKVALRFRARVPRSPLGSKSPGAGVGDEETHPFDESTHSFDEATHPFDETTHPFDENTHPFDESTYPFDETIHPFDDSQTQSQEVHPFDEGSYPPSQETHPFDEDTQQPPDRIVDDQSQRRRPEVGASDISSAAGSSKRRTAAFLTASPLETRNGRHPKSPSHPPPKSPIDRLRPGVLDLPNHPPRSPQSLATHRPAAASSPLRRQEVQTPTTTSRNLLQSPRSSTEDVPILSPQRVRSGGLSPEGNRPKSTVTQELRELLENSPRTRRTPANVAAQSQTHGEA